MHPVFVERTAVHLLCSRPTASLGAGQPKWRPCEGWKQHKQQRDSQVEWRLTGVAWRGVVEETTGRQGLETGRELTDCEILLLFLI